MNIDFQRLQDDFRGLNFNDPGGWPFAPKLASYVLILVAAVVLGWLLDWAPQWETLGQKQQEELQLRESWLTKKRQAVNLDEYIRQLDEIGRQFESIVRQLPGKAEMDSLLSDINQAGVGRGLQFELFQPERDDIREFYAAMPVKISVTGNYRDLGEFAGDVAKMPRIVTIKNMVLTLASADGKKSKNANAASDGRLKLDATAETYRYLDEDEVSKQHQQQQRGGKK
ncbi:MAG: type 4a pilus biogenesis protein PilO [Azoarcus sp.]|jgi:type IV pilus assembly protein PilO|nr:type 4a pilus biogenesis protein PilO [Azoarcus sp.]